MARGVEATTATVKSPSPNGPNGPAAAASPNGPNGLKVADITPEVAGILIEMAAPLSPRLARAIAACLTILRGSVLTESRQAEVEGLLRSRLVELSRLMKGETVADKPAP